MGGVSTHRSFCRHEIPPRSPAKADSQFAKDQRLGKATPVHNDAEKPSKAGDARVILPPRAPVIWFSRNRCLRRSLTTTLGVSNEERERYTAQLSRYLPLSRGMLYAVDRFLAPRTRSFNYSIRMPYFCERTCCSKKPGGAARAPRFRSFRLATAR
jgi:hypothetical protein